MFDDIFGEENIEVLCRKVGNGAPWNFPMFEFLSPTKVIWKDPNGFVLNKGEQLEQDIVFNHFSHFTPDYENKRFAFDRGGEWGPIYNNPGVTDVYVNYMHELISTKGRYGL